MVSAFLISMTINHTQRAFSWHPLMIDIRQWTSSFGRPNGRRHLTQAWMIETEQRSKRLPSCTILSQHALFTSIFMAGNYPLMFGDSLALLCFAQLTFFILYWPRSLLLFLISMIFSLNSSTNNFSDIFAKTTLSPLLFPWCHRQWWQKKSSTLLRDSYTHVTAPSVSLHEDNDVRARSMRSDVYGSFQSDGYLIPHIYPFLLYSPYSDIRLTLKLLIPCVSLWLLLTTNHRYSEFATIH